MNRIYNIWVNDLSFFEQIKGMIPENIKLTDISELRKETSEEIVIDAILLSDWPNHLLLEELSKHIEPHRTFYVADLKINNRQIEQFVRKSCARTFAREDFGRMLVLLSRVLYEKQYGIRYTNESIDIHPDYKGRIHYDGHNKVTTNVDSVDGFKQLLMWKKTIYLEADIPLELWLEHHCEPSVELKLQIVRIKVGTTDEVQGVQSYSHKELEGPIIINESGSQEYISASLYVKGQGEVSVGNLHARYSRLGLGDIVLGGNRVHSKDNEEFMYYFHPGDLKPPLNVYFSGYRELEGFEGYNMLKEPGAPFLIVTDPRLKGGAFYVGDDEYEEKIVNTIQSHLDFLGFDNKDLILSGLSMGTYGALYYSTFLNPHAVILGKPLINLGTMAENETILRPHIFPTSLDLLVKNEGSLTKESAQNFNNKYWQRLNQHKLTDIEYYISYMIHDDYDNGAFTDLLNQLPQEDIKVVGKGFVGRHNDNTGSIVRWFLIQLKSVMGEYGRRDTVINE